MSEPDDVAASLVAELTGQGDHVDDGGFTLDPTAAREKLRAYQLTDAHEWILLAVSAGYVATGGRGPVHVHSGARTSVRFAGISLGAAQLEHCFAAVFSRERGLDGEALTRARVLRLLGLAANAALSLGADVEIESVEPGGECHVLRVSPDGTQVIEREHIEQAEIGVRIDVGSGRGRRRTSREHELVVERCRLATTAIVLDEQPISLGPTFVMPVQRAEIRLGDAVVGMAAFEQYGVEPAKALIINRGVLAETVTLGDCLTGFVAIVDVDLPTDLSQRQILRDQAWDRLLAAIRSVHDALPRPRFDPGGLASEGGGARPWSHAAVFTTAVVCLALLVAVLVSWLGSDEDPTPEQLLSACENRDRVACATLIDQTQDPAELRMLWRLSCRAGDTTHCMLVAEATHASDPEASVAALYRLCRDGLVEACKRGLPLAGDPETAATIEHAWCFHTGDETRCSSWRARALTTCEDPMKCAAMRELLRGTCMSGTGEFCLKAGWLAHLGYGGPPADATALFRRGCETKSKIACEWLERSVSEPSCTDGDAWACYALGYEAYHWQGDTEASLGRFERACELDLEAGCRAVEFVRRRMAPPMAFPQR